MGHNMTARANREKTTKKDKHNANSIYVKSKLQKHSKKPKTPTYSQPNSQPMQKPIVDISSALPFRTILNFYLKGGYRLFRAQ
jgi:hypothetical protein